MDEDDLTVDGRFRSRDIINADTASLETDPEAVLVSECAEERLRAALERHTGASYKPPTVFETLVLEALYPLLNDWLEPNLAPLVELLVDLEIGRIMASGDRTKQLEADDALV